MSKVFEFSGGSYIDKVSGVVGVHVNSNFHRTEKGIAWQGGVANSFVDFYRPLVSASYSIVAWVNKKTNSTQYLADFRIAAGAGVVWVDSSNVITPSSGTSYVDGVQTTDYPNDTEFHCIIVTGITLENTGTGSNRLTIGRSNGNTLQWSGHIPKVQIFEGVLTSGERAKIQSEFNNASPVTRAVKDNLDYPALKPHDLSHLVDSRIGNPDADQTQHVENGTFPSGHSEWALAACTGDSSNGYLELTATGTANARMVDEAAKLFVIGKTYLLEFDQYTPSSNVNVDGFTFSIVNPGQQYFAYQISIQKDTWETKRVLFTVSGAIEDIYLYLNQSNGSRATLNIGDKIRIDNISIKEWNGEELVPDADVGFVMNLTSSWIAQGANTLSQDGNAVKITYVDNDDGAWGYLRDTTTGSTFANFVTGDKLRVVLRIKVDTGSTQFRLYQPTGYVEEVITNTEWQLYTWDIIVSGLYPYFRTNGLDNFLWIEILSIMKVTGLVAAYNMIPSPGAVLVDISGEGNEGAINGAMSTKDGIKVSDSLSSGIEIGNSSSEFPTLKSVFTVCSVIKPHTIGGDRFLFVVDTGGTLRTVIIIYSVGAIRVSNYNVSVFNANPRQSNAFVQENKWSTLVVSYDQVNDITKIWVDGIEGSTAGGNESTIPASWIGSRGIGDISDAEFADVKFFNYALSEQQAKDYHNQFARQVNKKLELSDHGVGSTI